MPPFTAVVLAGGRATRLGGVNKALLDVGGKRLLDRVLDALRPLSDQVVLVGRLAEGIGGIRQDGVEIVSDALPAGGALVAIYSGLLAARHEVSLVVACDMPFLSTVLLERIGRLSEGHDLAVPRVGPHLEALHAAYSRSCLPIMADAIRCQQYKIIDFYPRVRFREVGIEEIRDVDPDLRSFFNINTPADLERARALASLP